jgi:hypothetical protein
MSMVSPGESLGLERKSGAFGTNRSESDNDPNLNQPRLAANCCSCGTSAGTPMSAPNYQHTLHLTVAPLASTTEFQFHGRGSTKGPTRHASAASCGRSLERLISNSLHADQLGTLPGLEGPQRSA